MNISKYYKRFRILLALAGLRTVGWGLQKIFLNFDINSSNWPLASNLKGKNTKKWFWDTFTNNFFDLKLPSQTLIFWALFSKNGVFYTWRKTARLRGVQIWVKWCLNIIVFTEKKVYGRGNFGSDSRGGCQFAHSNSSKLIGVKWYLFFGRFTRFYP